MIRHLNKDLQMEFKIKDLGELCFFVGLEIIRSSEGIVVNHIKFPLKLSIEIIRSQTCFYIIVKLQYFTNTKLDIVFDVQTLSQYMQKQNKAHPFCNCLKDYQLMQSSTAQHVAYFTILILSINEHIHYHIISIKFVVNEQFNHEKRESCCQIC